MKLSTSFLALIGILSCMLTHVEGVAIRNTDVEALEAGSEVDAGLEDDDNFDGPVHKINQKINEYKWNNIRHSKKHEYFGGVEMDSLKRLLEDEAEMKAATQDLKISVDAEPTDPRIKSILLEAKASPQQTNRGPNNLPFSSGSSSSSSSAKKESASATSTSFLQEASGTHAHNTLTLEVLASMLQESLKLQLEDRKNIRELQKLLGVRIKKKEEKIEEGKKAVGSAKGASKTSSSTSTKVSSNSTSSSSAKHKDNGEGESTQSNFSSEDAEDESESSSSSSSSSSSKPNSGKDKNADPDASAHTNEGAQDADEDKEDRSDGSSADSIIPADTAALEMSAHVTSSSSSKTASGASLASSLNVDTSAAADAAEIERITAEVQQQIDQNDEEAEHNDLKREAVEAEEATFIETGNTAHTRAHKNKRKKKKLDFPKLQGMIDELTDTLKHSQNH